MAELNCPGTTKNYKNIRHLFLQLHGVYKINKNSLKQVRVIIFHALKVRRTVKQK